MVCLGAARIDSGPVAVGRHPPDIPGRKYPGAGDGRGLKLFPNKGRAVHQGPCLFRRMRRQYRYAIASFIERLTTFTMIKADATRAGLMSAAQSSRTGSY